MLSTLDNKYEQNKTTMSADRSENRSNIDLFEAMLCNYCGAKYAAITNSFRMGLSLALVVAGLGKDDEIITSPQISANSVNAIMNSMATPVLVDCDKQTALIDPQRIEDAITPRTKAILATHVAGRPCDMDMIGAIAQRHGLIVIENGEHALESIHNGRKIGNLSPFSCFSFNGLTRLGSGKFGAVTTNNPFFADNMKNVALEDLQRKNWGYLKSLNYFPEIFLKCNFNLKEVLAIFGLRQLEKLEADWQRRSDIWQAYNSYFAGLPIDLPPEPPSDTRHAYQIYSLSIDVERCGVSRDMFRQKMFESQIETAVHYIGVHLLPDLSKQFGFTREDFPNATWLSEHSVSIPLSTRFSDSYVKFIGNSVRSIFNAQ